MSSGNLEGNIGARLINSLRNQISLELTASGRASKPDWELIQQLDQTVQKIKKWENTMTRRTYRIELKIDFQDDDRHQYVGEIVRRYARDILSSTMLLQDGRKPLVAVQIEDSFIGSQEVDLMPESDNFHKPEADV
jgi:hypothetical protein